MARIRTIKPEFPQSESVGRLSRDARLLFIQLWTLVDDDGRARAPSRMLASLLYPYDDDAPGLIDGWLDELDRTGCIRRYQVDGHHYLDIPKWLDHQKIDHAKPSKLPGHSDAVANCREPSRIGAPDLDHGLDHGSLPSSPPDGATPPDDAKSHSSKKGSRLPADWKPSKDDVVYAVEKGVPPDKVATVAEEFRNFWVARPGKDGVKLDWVATWRNRVIQVCERNGWQPRQTSPPDDRLIHVMRDDQKWEPLAHRYQAEHGKQPPVDKNGGWRFPSDWLSTSH